MEIHGDILSCAHTYIVHQTNYESTYVRGLAQKVFLKYPYADTSKSRSRTPGKSGTIDIFGDG